MSDRLSAVIVGALAENIERAIVEPKSLEDEKASRDDAANAARFVQEHALNAVDDAVGVPVAHADSCETPDIELVIIRHGQTPGNAARRYVGCASDQPLSDRGREQARAARSFPEVTRVYVSFMKRTHETAAIMFPNAEQVEVEGIHEMDFGVFTGRSADEMADDEQYCDWVAGWCEGQCPGGESKAQFSERICAAMRAFLREAFQRGEHQVYMVAHGGTLMSFLGAYGGVEGKYYEWNVGNCQGYRLGIRLVGDDVRITSIELIGA